MIDIKKIAKTARLNLTVDEAKAFSKDMENILEAFKGLEKADTNGVEPTTQPVEVRNVFREDKKENCLQQKDALSNSKNTEKGYFRGPKAV